MKDIFTVEEINLMCIYDTSDKAVLITELKNSLPEIYDPDMRDIYESAIEKLEKISDDDFSDIGFYIADEYIEETEV
jgi:hypothetical protein